MTHHFFVAVLTYLIATASPGPSVMALMAVAMQQGRRDALAVACGIISGSVWWGSLAMLGFAGVLQTYAQLLVVLKFLGAAYLFWLAFNALRKVVMHPSGSRALPVQSGSFARLYLRGLKLHLSNPKSIFTWLAIASLSAQGAPTWRDQLQLLLTCAVICSGVFFTYAVVFSTTSAQRYYLRCERFLHMVLTLTFGVAAVKLLTADH